MPSNRTKYSEEIKHNTAKYIIESEKSTTSVAVVMDLYNREIIGYSISKNIDTELVLRTTCNAIGKNPYGVQGTIFHSDRGSQYTSKGLKNILKFEGMVQSMSKAGSPYVNSCVESSFASLKKEWIYRKDYKHIDEVKNDLFEYIELFYNRKRLHSFFNGIFFQYCNLYILLILIKTTYCCLIIYIIFS